MAEEDSTTKKTEESKTYFNWLPDAVNLTFAPIEAFYDLLDENEQGGGVANLLMVLRQLLDKQRDDLEKIYEAIDRTLGRVELEAPSKMGGFTWIRWRWIG